MSSKTGIVRLTPAQASHFWSVLSIGFMKALPPGVLPGTTVANNILTGIHRRTHDCWVIQRRSEAGQKQIGAAITTVQAESTSAERELVLYAVYSNGDMSDVEWGEALGLLATVAKKAKCRRIIAYSKNPRMIALAESLGGRGDTRVIELEV